MALLPLLFIRGNIGAQTRHYFSSLAILGSLGTKPRQRAGKLRFSFVVIPLFLFITALARPQWSENFEQHKHSGIDIVLAIDVSKSMDIDDFVLDNKSWRRLDAAKEIAKNFIKKRPNDRIGVIAFAGQPYRVSPITMSHSWLEPLINQEVIFSRKVTPGTAIGSAISSASNLLISDAKDSKTKLIILITDGSSNQGLLTPAQAAKNAKDAEIKVYTLGIGTKEGRLSNRAFNMPMQEFDTTVLEEVAQITDGQFYRAETTESLEESFAMIDTLEKSEASVFSYSIVDEFHHWFTGIGLALLSLHMIYHITLGGTRT